jgi:hypothetical protein
MTRAARVLGLIYCFVLVSTISSLSQSTDATAATSSSSPAAFVYVQTQGSSGPINAYSANSSGVLSTISGSPFSMTGLMIGSNRYQFISLGTNDIHAYKVGSNGAIGDQVSVIDTADYAGGVCGTSSGTAGAVLDHTGKYLYVTLASVDETCAAYQSYIINSDGAFSFDGDTEITWQGCPTGCGNFGFDPPSILGSESFAYSQYADTFQTLVSGFRRESSGTLEYLPNFTWTAPAVTGGYIAMSPDASPTGNYVVLELFPEDVSPPQLGSFTVNSQGNLTTTNTSSNMPTSSLNEPSTTFSPSGNLFVAYGTMSGGSNGKGAIEIYKFNGAAPLTLWKTLLDGTPINQVGWDGANHMYAISTTENKLYVFTVTSTSVTETSSVSIGAPYRMIVVSE